MGHSELVLVNYLAVMLMSSVFSLAYGICRCVRTNLKLLPVRMQGTIPPPPHPSPRPLWDTQKETILQPWRSSCTTNTLYNSKSTCFVKDEIFFHKF